MSPFLSGESEAQTDLRIVLRRLFGDKAYSGCARGEQTLLPRTVWQPETWGYSWNVRVMVEPGPWNEIEEIMKSWALQEQARGPRSTRMASLSF